MLAAVLHGKAARVTVDGKNVSWRELFRQREDLLTAAFFGRFLYLSPTKRQEALALLVNSRVATDLGDIEEIIFWPSLWLSEEDGGGRVEPDVIIRCEMGLVMVEVKPPWGYQYEAQWHNEVKALMEAVSSGADVGFEPPENVHFVALGQNSGLDIKKSFEDFDTEGFFDFESHQKEWSDVLKGFDDWEDMEESGDGAVVADWRSAFALFGVRRPIKPLAEVCRLPLVLEDSLSLLVKMRSAEPESEHHLPPLPWRPLLSLSGECFMEGSQCLSLLKTLANS
ncbi:MAG: hypothetical protein DELT_02216 [Desulfovibrio sp.]